MTVPGYTSFCDVSGAISCTQAYLSRSGSLWGVPVALGGVVYFATVLLIAGVAGQSSAGGRENVPAYHLRAVDRCARVCAVSRLGVSLQAEHGLPALRDHVCRGHRAIHHLGWCDYISHDFIASARVHGCGKTRQEPARSRLGGRAQPRHAGTAERLPARGARPGGCAGGGRLVCVHRGGRAGARAHGSAEDGLPRSGTSSSRASPSPWSSMAPRSWW